MTPRGKALVAPVATVEDGDGCTRVALYLRCPTGECASDPDQRLASLRSFAAAQDWTIVGVYLDHAALGGKQPAAWRALLEDAATHRVRIVLVESVEGLFRSAGHLFDAIMALRSRAVDFCSAAEGFDTWTAGGQKTLRVLASLWRAERSAQKARIQAGMARARAQGKRLGRPPITSRPDVARRWPLVAQRLQRGEISLGEAARLIKISKTTVRRLLAEWERDPAGASPSLPADDGGR